MAKLYSFMNIYVHTLIYIYICIYIYIYIYIISQRLYFMKVTHDSNMDTIVALRYQIREGGAEREENPTTRSKTLEAQERLTAGNLSHEMSHTSLGFSGERHNPCFPSVLAPRVLPMLSYNIYPCNMLQS